ncbi:kelch-like protein 5 [Paramacrobiotus metropolitanus]|uniref:kelch-like protein 5 n=1 Tax=Paramacrobiotus metropolitanus TaxID=2943436 RepID=UPI002445C1E2|nr:kelch-like protein 5 [Paramacrobiotus metropolitanus]
MAANEASEQGSLIEYKSGQDERITQIGAVISDFDHKGSSRRAPRTLCDVELRGCETESSGIPCHRNALSEHSAYFRNMFLSGMKESTEQVIQLQNISCSVLSVLVDYCYTTDIHVNESNVEPLLIAASFLSMDSVLDISWQFLEDRMQVSNCMTLYSLAESDAHKNPVLAGKARAFISKHFVGVSHGPELLEAPKNTIIELIRSDALCVPREDDVLVAVVRWLQHDFEQRRREFWEILQYIRTKYLGPQASDDYLLACINAVRDYSGAEEALHRSEQLKVLPGHITEASSFRHTARKSYGYENVIVCAGGHQDSSWTSLLDSVECFNPRTMGWRSLPKLPSRVAKGGLAVLNRDLFVCGGIIGYVVARVTGRTLHYNSALGVWNNVAPMNTNRGDLGVVAVGQHIYAIGGHGTDTHTLATVERYDAVANQWTYVAPLPTPLEKFAVATFEGQIFAFGGCTSNENTAGDTGLLNYVASNSAFSYDSKSNTWLELPKMPTARYRASACVGSDGWLYVIGDMRRPLFSAGTWCIGDKIYVLGGLNGTVGLKTIEVYDIISDTWTTSESQLMNGKWAFGSALVEIAKESSQEFYV